MSSSYGHVARPPLSRGVLLLATWAEVLAWIAAGFFAVATILRVAIIPLLDDYWTTSPRDREALDNADTVESAASNVFSFGWLSFIAVVILLMVLWFRVLHRSKELGAEFPLGPGWAVGSWFIPVANLVLTALVAANVVRLAEWRGVAPIGKGWRRRFPRTVVIPPVAVVLSFVSMSVGGSTQPDGFRSDAVAQGGEAFGTSMWVLALIATAILLRRTRQQLALGPLVSAR